MVVTIPLSVTFLRRLQRHHKKLRASLLLCCSSAKKRIAGSKQKRTEQNASHVIPFWSREQRNSGVC